MNGFSTNDFKILVFKTQMLLTYRAIILFYYFINDNSYKMKCKLY